MKTERPPEEYKTDGFYEVIPERTIDALIRYVEQRIPTGDFLRAVLSNNLFEAIGRADHENFPALKEICTFVYQEIPSACWGSKEKAAEWLKGGPSEQQGSSD